jgi:hypothetical protein
MWRCIRLVAIAAAFLAGATATAYAQDSMTPYPGKAAPGKSKSDKAGPNSGGTASGGNGTLGAGDPAKGDWTGTNLGVNRGPAATYSGYGVGNLGGRVAPGGNGALGAGDASVGGWTGTNPGIDRRAPLMTTRLPVSLPSERRTFSRRLGSGVDASIPVRDCGRRLAAGHPPASVRRVKQEDPAYLLDRVRVRLRGVARADDVFGIDTVEMRARILDDTVVAALDGPVAGNSNDRMRVDARGNRRRGHHLQDRIVWRHAEQAARSEIARVDLEVSGIPREFGAGLDDARRESEKSSQELGD